MISFNYGFPGSVLEILHDFFLSETELYILSIRNNFSGVMLERISETWQYYLAPLKLCVKLRGRKRVLDF